MDESKWRIKPGRWHACQLGHLKVRTDHQTIALRVLLVVLIREHSAKHVDAAIVALSGCSPHRQPGRHLLLDEFALLKIEEV